jgi:hypothetical protein
MDMPWGYTDTSFLMASNRSPDDLAEALERMNYPSLEKPKAVDDTDRATSWACIDVLNMIDVSEDLSSTDEESIACKIAKMTVSPPTSDDDPEKDGTCKIGRANVQTSKPLKKGQRLQFWKAGERRRPILNVKPQQLRLQSNH